jgi:hypothetical protein
MKGLSSVLRSFIDKLQSAGSLQVERAFASLKS